MKKLHYRKKKGAFGGFQVLKNAIRVHWLFQRSLVFEIKKRGENRIAKSR